MRFTVTYPLVSHPCNEELVSRDALVRFVQVAEKVGFDGVGFTDHPAPTARWLKAGGHDALEPLVALAFCAAVTERVRLIPNILVLPYRHPLLVAKAVATLDLVSGGRFILAAATGYLRGEYRALGVTFEDRNALFDQAVEVLRGVWSQEPFSYAGRGVDAHDLAVNPKPRPLPPLWIGGNSRRARRRVARYGDGWTPFPAPEVLARTAKTPPLRSVEDLASMLEELWRFVEEEGRDPSSVDVAFGTHAGGSPGDRDFDADAHLDALEQLAGLGVTWAGVGVPGDSLAHALEALEHYGEAVIAPSR